MQTITINRWHVLALLWFLMSVYGLFLKAPSTEPPLFNQMDKVAHFVMFLGQFYSVGKIYQRQSNKQPYSWLLMLAVFWAIFSELIQGYFTARTMDVWDGVADTIGALCACFLLVLTAPKSNNHKTRAQRR